MFRPVKRNLSGDSMTENQIAAITEVKTIAVGDMKVRVSGTGFPLILVHGFTTTSEFWREQVEEF
jgi:hypothetical protein